MKLSQNGKYILANGMVYDISLDESVSINDLSFGFLFVPAKECHSCILIAWTHGARRKPLFDICCDWQTLKVRMIVVAHQSPMVCPNFYELGERAILGMHLKRSGLWGFEVASNYSVHHTAVTRDNNCLLVMLFDDFVECGSHPSMKLRNRFATREKYCVRISAPIWLPMFSHEVNICHSVALRTRIMLTKSRFNIDLESCKCWRNNLRCF